MTITLNLTASPELLAAFQAIAAALTGKPAPTAVSSNGKVKKETPAPVAAAAPAATKTEEITIEQVRAAVTAKTAAGEDAKEKVKALLAEFGAAKVPALKPEHYADFLTKLGGI